MQASRLAICGLAMLLLAAPAQARTGRRAAADGKGTRRDHQECLAAYFAGQEMVEAGRLRDARRRFQACADQMCGARVQQECQARYTQLATDIPSVIPLVTASDGTPLADVVVTVDGQPLTKHLDGRAVPVDPGLHLFSFSAGGESQSVKVMIIQGERNRALNTTLGDEGGASAEIAPPARKKEAVAAARRPSPFRRVPSDEADAPISPRADDSDRPEQPRARRHSEPSRLPYYFLGGVGVAGLAGYGLLASWARGDNDRLAQCAPTCPTASVDHIHNLYTAAHVSLGVGLAALAATTTMYLLSGPKKKELSYSFDLRPTTSGAMASLGGVF
jgi:hypothetical protein